MCSCIQCGSMALYGPLRIQINQIHILYIHFHYLVVRLISKFPPKNKLPLAQVYLFHDYDIVSYKFSGKFPKDCNILSTFLFFLFAFYNTKIHICISNRNSSWVTQFYHVFNLDACVYTDRKIQISMFGCKISSFYITNEVFIFENSDPRISALKDSYIEI